MPEVQWIDLSGAEQEAFELVASGDTSHVTSPILVRLIELGLVNKTQIGPAISRVGLQLLAARGIPPRAPYRDPPG